MFSFNIISSTRCPVSNLRGQQPQPQLQPTTNPQPTPQPPQPPQQLQPRPIYNGFQGPGGAWHLGNGSRWFGPVPQNHHSHPNIHRRRRLQHLHQHTPVPAHTQPEAHLRPHQQMIMMMARQHKGGGGHGCLRRARLDKHAAKSPKPSSRSTSNMATRQYLSPMLTHQQHQSSSASSSSSWESSSESDTPMKRYPVQAHI